LWMHLSLMMECCARTERALAVIAAETDGDTRCEMKLQAAFAVALMYSRGAVPEIGTAGTRALEIAKNLDDAEYQLRSLWGLWSFHTGNAQHDIALTLAQRFHALAAKRSDLHDRLIGDRIIGTTQFYLGDLPGARRHIERVLAHEVTAAEKWRIFRFEVDQWAAARISLARILWLQGFPDQAMRTAESSVAEARATNHAISIGQAFALAACPIALFRGDLTAAEHHVESLLDHSTGHALARWRAWGLSHQGVLAVKRGEFSTGLRLLRAGFDEPGATETVPQFFTFLMAEALGRTGQIAEGLAAINEALGYAESSKERWATSEMLRIKGELLLSQGAEDSAAAAADQFEQALDWARRQGALSWELRTATSLARLCNDQGRFADAKAILQPVYDRFTEGLDTSDLKTARMLLSALRGDQ
jgi:predicted ATPase